MDCSSVDAVSTQHWWAQIWIQPSEECYKGLMETGAPECRYLGKVWLVSDRTVPHTEDGSVLELILKAALREVFFSSPPFSSKSLSAQVYQDISQTQKLRQVIPCTADPILPKWGCLLSCSSGLSWSFSAPGGYYSASTQPVRLQAPAAFNPFY